jgi:preprotein translocase subunit SecG
METVVLSIHLILALLLIGVVLLQRSEGGGLGMGGGGGVMTGRQAANALSKMTWALAAGFLATSVTLTILAANKAEEGSVVDRVTETAPAEAAPADAPALPATDAPAVPPSADAPVTPPAAN